MENIFLTTFTLDELRKIVKECVADALIENNQWTTMKGSENLMTVTEASDFLNLAVQTIYGYTSQQLIPFAKRGKRLYFNRSELIEWVQGGRRKTRFEIELEADNYMHRSHKKK